MSNGGDSHKHPLTHNMKKKKKMKINSSCVRCVAIISALDFLYMGSASHPEFELY